MNIGLPIIGILLIYYLYDSSKRDQKKFLKYKAINAISVLLLYFAFSNAFRWLGWIVGHPEDVSEMFFVPLGFIPAWMNVSFLFLFTISGMSCLMLLFSISKRNGKRIKLFTKLIPIFYLANIVEGFRGAVKTGAEENSLTYQVILLSVLALFFAIIFIPMYLFYSSKKVREEFFGVENKLEPVSAGNA